MTVPRWLEIAVLLPALLSGLLPGGCCRAEESPPAIPVRTTAGAAAIEEAREAVRCSEYRPPADEEIALAEALFSEVFARRGTGGEVASLADSGRRVGLELLEIRQGGEEFIALREEPGRRRGMGFYAFRRGDIAPIALQTPHSFSDLHTGAIVERLFLESRAAAAAWNTAPRSAPVRDDRGGRSSREERSGADLAHLGGSYFNAFTRAFAAAHPDGILIQIHGFDGQLRAAESWPGWGVILSDGTASPPAELSECAQRLGRDLSIKAALFPRDIGELGAVTNAQGKIIRSLGRAAFLHVELDLPVRRRLRREEAYRKSFLECLPGKQP
jgi:hypothetical protein